VILIYNIINESIYVFITYVHSKILFLIEFGSIITVEQMENELNRKQNIEDIENIKSDNDPDRDYKSSKDSATDTDYEFINEMK